MTEPAFALRRNDLGWLLLSALILLPCLYYPYRSIAPHLPFTLGADWRVRTTEPCAAGASCLEAGDRVLAIGGVTREEFAAGRNSDPFRPFELTAPVEVHLLRHGTPLLLAIQPGPAPPGQGHGEALMLFFPFVFWLMGTVAVIFLRPHDERWWVLVLFHYVTALWLASGLASSRQVAGAAIVFHFFIWFFLPLAVHLHLILPEPLFQRGRNILLGVLYAGSLGLAAIDAARWLDGLQSLYALSFLLGVALALVFLLARLLLPVSPAVRLANRIMLFGVAVGFGPVILFFIPTTFATDFLDAQPGLRSFFPWALGLSLLAIPILPLSYIYAIYKHNLGALEFRANRLLGLYSFFALYIGLYVATLSLALRHGTGLDRREMGIILGISLAFVAVAPFVLGQFQALIDRYVFGIRHSPEEVVRLVASKIPTAFNRDVLAKVVVEEILPTLLIRQSALHLFAEGGEETLYQQGLTVAEAETTPAELQHLLTRAGRYLPPGPPASASLDWVRLVIPLGIQAEVIGIWLFGRRDPDDHYPASDAQLLATVANQIAPMLSNIRLYERAQQEIAQRRAAEAEIRRSEERYRTLFEATLEGIAIVRNGTILAVNHALLGIFGYTSSPELAGQPLSALLPATEPGASDEPREGVGRRRDGSPVNIEIAAKKSVLQGEDVTVVAIRDIERRKRDEEENRQLQRQLLHSQKMEAIGRLSAGVAHDFNNCLLAIFGLSDFLIARYGGDELLTRSLGGIRDAGQKAANLTKQLLAFTRQQPMEPKVMSLNDVVTGVGEMVRGVLGSGTELTTHLAPELPPVRIDRVQIEQVILNLAVNSHDAMPWGGRLTLETDLVELAAAELPDRDLAAGRYARLRVSDTGVGMDTEVVGRVFEPFFSTKKLGEGTGLGLSTAYGIVQQSGGHIMVASVLGKGTTFTIVLPAVESPPLA